MFLELRECIKDAFDPAMKTYVESDDYKMMQWEFNKMYIAFYNDLPEGLRKRFTELSNARDELESCLALEAYYRGVVHGIEVHNDVK